MAAQPSRRGAVLRAVLLSGLLAGLFSCLVGYGLAYQWFVRWRTLPPQPGLSDLAGATVNSVDAQAADGDLYRYDFQAAEPGWQPVDAPLTRTDAPCPLPGHVRPPRAAAGRLLVCRNYADGGETALYVLGENGRVYAWRAADSAYQVMLLFACPALGIPLGLLAGLIFGLLRKPKNSPAL